MSDLGVGAAGPCAHGTAQACIAVLEPTHMAPVAPTSVYCKVRNLEEETTGGSGGGMAGQGPDLEAGYGQAAGLVMTMMKLPIMEPEPSSCSEVGGGQGLRRWLGEQPAVHHRGDPTFKYQAFK